MSQATKTIVVFTVTGDQGSSVARYLIKDGGYKVVGITRNSGSEAARGESCFLFSLFTVSVQLLSSSSPLGQICPADYTALAEIGVELVKGDLSDPSTYKDALKGAYGAFVNADCEF